MLTLSGMTSLTAILAFLVAFYTLFARERKTPYITNYLFFPVALILIALILVLAHESVQAWVNTHPDASGHTNGHTTVMKVAQLLTYAATAIFYLGVVRIAWNLWRLHNRQVNFRDDKLIKNTRTYRRIRSYLRRTKNAAPPYEHNAEEIDAKQFHELLANTGIEYSGPEPIRTMAVCGESLRKTDISTVDLAASLLEKGWLVQYTTCARHPSEWINLLKVKLGTTWKQSVARLAVVDGYTPHFGFTDSIHAVKTEEVRGAGVAYFATSETYAGVHTATAKAFNALKERSKAEVRKPTLQIYEGCRSLVDIESVEQYRLFLRHVITSERMWGGMVSYFVEPETDELSLALIGSYSDLVIKPSETGAANAKS